MTITHLVSRDPDAAPAVHDAATLAVLAKTLGRDRSDVLIEAVHDWVRKKRREQGLARQDWRMPPEREPTVCTGCHMELCPACGACPCLPEADWSCRRAEHWRPENRS